MATLPTTNPQGTGTGGADNTGLPTTDGTAFTGFTGTGVILGDSNDGTRINQGTNSTGNYETGWPLASCWPSDFDTMLTLNLKLRRAWSASVSNSTWQMKARVMASDGSTVLAAQDSSGGWVDHGNITDTTPTDGSLHSFLYVNTSASKTTWDAGILQLRFERVRSKGGDSASQQVYEATFGGTYTPTTADVTVTPGVASLTLTGYAPTPVLPKLVTPGVVSMTLTGYAPDVTVATTVEPGVINLTLSRYAPNIVTPVTVTPDVSALTLTTFIPVLDLSVIPPPASLALTTYAPDVTATDFVIVTPPPASLTLTTYIPDVTIPLVVVPPAVALTLTGYAPDVSTPVLVTPGVTALTLTGYAPDVSTPVLVTPPVVSLTMTGYAPDIVTPVTVTPPVVALTLTTYIPTVTAGAGLTIVPGVANLTLSGLAPTITTTQNVIVRPGAASLTLTGYAPVLDTGVIPPTVALTMTGYAPVVTATDHQLVTPGVASLTLTTYIPNVVTPQTITPGVASLTLTTYAPDVTALAGLTVTPGVATLTLTGLAPTVTATANIWVTPGVASLVLTGYAPDVSTPQTITPGVASLTLTGLAPTVAITDFQIVTPGVATLALTTYAPLVGTSVLVTPGARSLVLTTYIPAVTVSVGYPPYIHRIGRRLIQMHALLYDSDANGGPGNLKADLTPDLLNTFWQRSMNLSGTAAMVLSRSNPKNTLIVPGVDHIELWRETRDNVTRVFQGKMAEPSIATGDVVWRAVDYLGYLQRSRTGYRTFYKGKVVGSEIIAPEWALAQGADTSPLAFVATGTIENPLAIDGTTPIETNDEFGVNYFDRLFTFYALAEMSMVNTDNNVVFEITTSATPTFNFWKNRSSDADPVFSYPGNLIAFNYAPGYIDIVNDLASVVKKSGGGGQEGYAVEDTASIATYRRLQSAVAIETLMGLDSAATEADQMKAALERLLVGYTRLPKLFVVLPRFMEIEPFVGWDLGDNFYSFVQKAGEEDTDEVAAWLRCISVAASWQPSGMEQMTMYLRGKE